MGASISISKRTARVRGVEALHGADIQASDLRAGAALIVAGLSAGGETRVRGVEYIDRGYEHLEHKFNALGGCISRK